MYQTFRRRTNWINYRKIAKIVFFNSRIQEIVLSNKRLWDFMNWVKKHKLPATDAIKFNRLPYNKLNDLWQTLHQLYN